MIAFLTKDLIFQSRVSGAAKQSGQLLICAFSVDSLKPKIPEAVVPSLIIVDLSMTGLDIAGLGTELRSSFPDCRLIAYAPHVAEAVIDAAKNSAFDLVLTRGQFDRMYPQLIAEAASH